MQGRQVKKSQQKIQPHESPRQYKQAEGIFPDLTIFQVETATISLEDLVNATIEPIDNA